MSLLLSFLGGFSVGYNGWRDRGLLRNRKGALIMVTVFHRVIDRLLFIFMALSRMALQAWLVKRPLVSLLPG